MPDITICADWAGRVVGVIGLGFAVAALVYAREIGKHR